MKNTIKIAILFLSLTGALSANDLDKENLKGKVSTISAETYSLVQKFGIWIHNSITGLSLYSYNSRGNIFEKADYSAEEMSGIKIILTHNDKGNKTEQAYYNADGTLSGKFIYAYDDKGNRIEQSYYNAGGPLSNKRLYTYDDNGNQTEVAYYNGDGTLENKFSLTLKYDKTGNWISQITGHEVFKFGKTYFEPIYEIIRTITLSLIHISEPTRPY